jgi:hypothetical protein
MKTILLTGNHALRTDQEFDFGTNIKEGAYQSFRFCRYDDHGKPIKRWKGIIKTEQLFELLTGAGLLKEEDVT